MDQTITIPLPTGEEITGNPDMIASAARALGYSDERVETEVAPLIDAAIEAMATVERRDAVRRTLEREVGDTQSILGTSMDVLGFMMAAQAARVVALADHASNECDRAELEMLRLMAQPADIVAESRRIVDGLASGEIALTIGLKGLPEIVGEAIARMTKARAVLAAAHAASGTDADTARP